MLKGKELRNEWDDFLQTGREQSFYELYSHYYDYLFYIGLKKEMPLEKVKDCINDLFLYIFENRGKLHSVNHHHNYLVTVFLRNLFRKEHFSCADYMTFDEEQFPDVAVQPSAETLHIQQDIQEEISRKLKGYMNRLSLNQSKIIYQKFYLGLTYPEIAKANGINVKTAYNTVLQAIAKLKKVVGTEDLNTLLTIISKLGVYFLLFFNFS